MCGDVCCDAVSCRERALRCCALRCCVVRLFGEGLRCAVMCRDDELDFSGGDAGGMFYADECADVR